MGVRRSASHSASLARPQDEGTAGRTFEDENAASGVEGRRDACVGLLSSLLDRRTFLAAGVVLPVAFVACSDDGDGERAVAPRSTASLPPTPSCEDGDATASQTEGPFFTPDSPEKSDLYADVGRGTRLALSGAVLTTACRPVAGAVVDVWQADDEGNYDNDGYRLRGHVRTDGEGRYRFTTVVPGEYTGRTRHIHVKVGPPQGRVLTTQLYFPGEPANTRDGIYRRELEMAVRDAADGKEGSFTFVVEA